MSKKTLIVLSLVALITACGNGSKLGGWSKDKPDDKPKAPMLITSADLVTISSQRLASGPVISGSLQAQKQADLRAEVSAVVLQVLKDSGDKVAKGDLLVRLDDTTFRQALNSAQEAERVAQQSFDQAERQFTRLKTLFNTGAVSIQAKEDAELRRNAAQSDLAATHTRVVQDTQQLARTEVRAPFAGIVGNREVSSGDTAQVGKALMKVIDPSSIHFIGFIPADQITRIQIGQRVNFHVNGYRDQDFEGQIERINPVADANSRQVGVQVAIAKNLNLTVGLFAEGRVQSELKQGLSVPESSIIRQGDHAFVWRVKNGVLNKVEVTLGERDLQSGDYAVVTGLTEGEPILRHPLGALVDGARAEIEPSPANKKED